LVEKNCQRFLPERKSIIQSIIDSRSHSRFWRYDYRSQSPEEEIDPWNRLSDKSIDFYLFKQVAQREDQNVTIFTDEWRVGYNVETFPTISLLDLSFHGFLPHPYLYQIITRWSGLQFLTCYTEKYLGFGFYITPFQLDLWIGFLITMSTVVGISWVYTKFYFKDSTSMSFSPWLFVLGTMFEETSSAPGQLEKKTFYRLSIGIWCLMVAILTNCYNGLMITDLNSPLPGSKMESFKDLLCDKSLLEKKPDFNITQWIEASKISSYWASVYRVNFGKDRNISVINPYESRDCFRIWTPELQAAI
jgi:hypothetical protein